MVFFVSEYWYSYTCLIKWQYPEINESIIPTSNFDWEITLNLSQEIKIAKKLKLVYIKIKNWEMDLYNTWWVHKTNHMDINIWIKYAEIMNGTTLKTKWLMAVNNFKWWVIALRIVNNY